MGNYGGVALNSIEKVLWLIKRLGEPPYEMGLTELSREMGYGKSGVYKILSVLMAEKFVSQNPDNKRYYLGHILYRLGNVYIEQKRIWEVVEPIMREIVKITGETVSIGIREGDDTILAHFI